MQANDSKRSFQNQARRKKWGTRARAHPLFEKISSKIVVVPNQYLSPIKYVPTQHLIPSYGPEICACIILTENFLETYILSLVHLTSKFLEG